MPVRAGRWSLLSAVVGSLLLFLGIVAGLVNRQVLDGQRFAEHVDHIRRDPAVARQVGHAITAQLVARDPDLIALRPLIEATATSLASSEALSPVVRATSRQIHRAFTEEGSDDVVLRLADVGAVLSAALTALSPEAGARIPADLPVTLARVGGQSFAARTIHLTQVAGLLAWLLPLLSVVCFGLGLWVSTDRLRGTIRVGWAVVAAGAGVGVVAVVGTIIGSVADDSTFRGAVIAASWRELGGIVWRAAAITMLAGGVLLAAATARIPQVDPFAVLRQARTLVTRQPERRWPRIGRGAALVVVGVIAVLRPALLVTVLAGLVGLVVVVAGVAEVAQAAGARRVSRSDNRPRVRWPLAVAVVVALVTLVTLVAIGAAPSDRSISAVPAAEGNACNGHVQLCHRRYNDVAFPAGHNAMSAADEPGWFIPEQPTGPVGALDAGVRALLIDTWYGQSTNSPGVVATAPGSFPSARAATEQLYGPELLASALRVRNALAATPTGPVRPYLCHGLCEIGATAWEPLMAQVRAWLADHPREVITFFIEDYVSPADTAAVFSQAGLLPYVHTQAPGQPWPTLGQMIDSGRRVVVLMENHDGGATYPWMLQGFDWAQDTPYTNPSTADLTCALNRGSASNPLFLVNVWLSGFSSLVSNARTVNAFATLSPYLKKCRDQRGQIPNYVAVNFFNEGDVFRVVDQLNGFD